MARSRLVVPEEKVVAFKEPFVGRKLFGRFNKVCVVGRIVKDFKFSHEFGGTRYYTTVVESKRASLVTDHVPVIVSDAQMKDVLSKPMNGKYVEVAGRYRSYRVKGENNKTRLEYAVLATNIDFIEFDGKEDTNVLYLEGCICKKPVYKRTSTGRVITEFVIKVKKSYSRADLIPCIAWEKIADYAKNLRVGENVKVFGRLQSRKHLSNDNPNFDYQSEEERYEVSIWRLKKL